MKFVSFGFLRSSVLGFFDSTALKHHVTQECRQAPTWHSRPACYIHPLSQDIGSNPFWVGCALRDLYTIAIAHTTSHRIHIESLTLAAGIMAARNQACHDRHSLQYVGGGHLQNHGAGFRTTCVDTESLCGRF